MTSLAEIQRHTATQVLQGWNEHTVEGLLRDRTNDCVNLTLPKRLGRGARCNDDISSSIAKLSPILDDVKVSLCANEAYQHLADGRTSPKMYIWKTISDAESHAAVIHATAKGETPLGPYENEHVFFFAFTEDGSKVNRVEEYVDTSYSEAFVAKVMAYKQKAQS